MFDFLLIFKAWVLNNRTLFHTLQPDLKFIIKACINKLSLNFAKVLSIKSYFHDYRSIC